MSEVCEMPQVEKNYRAFRRRLPELLAVSQGKYALMHDENLVDVFDSAADAVRFGVEKYGSIAAFSVQEIIDHAATLGFYSYALLDVSEHSTRSAC